MLQNLVTFATQSYCVIGSLFNMSRNAPLQLWTKIKHDIRGDYVTRRYLKSLTCHKMILQWPFHCRASAQLSK